MLDLLHDLLHHWPLEMAGFWMFPLFFAGKFVHLGLLGLKGRGLPIYNSRRRWSSAIGHICSAALIASGATVFGGFIYWLSVALLG